MIEGKLNTYVPDVFRSEPTFPYLAKRKVGAGPWAVILVTAVSDMYSTSKYRHAVLLSGSSRNNQTQVGGVNENWNISEFEPLAQGEKLILQNI